MITLLGGLFIFLIGIIYMIFSRNKLVYINAPNDMISDDRKWKTLYGHIIASFIIGICFVNFFIRHIHPDTYKWLNEEGYLPYSFIGSIVLSFIIVASIIQLYFLKTNSYYANTKYLMENPELLVPEEHYITEESLPDQEFWNTIKLLEKPDYFIKELSNQHPIKLMKLYHALIDKKIKLIESGIIPISQYIFRKYQDDMTEDLCEFIISRGENTFNETISNLDKIHEIDFHPLSIRNHNITPLIGHCFIQNTGKPMVPTKEFIVADNIESLKKGLIEIKYPNIYKRFK